jgi:hypothetical protein
LNQCSGVIIENDGNNNHIVLTSANLIRRPTKGNVMEDNLSDEEDVMQDNLSDEEDFMEDNLADSLKVGVYNLMIRHLR